MGMLTILFCQIGETIGGLDALVCKAVWLNCIILGKTFPRGLIGVGITILATSRHSGRTNSIAGSWIGQGNANVT